MDGHGLEQFEGLGHANAAADWLDAVGAVAGPVLASLVRGGLAVRVSGVGYGRALRLSATDGRGWSCGWTVASLDELQALCRGLCAPGGVEYVLGRLEKPERSYRR